MTAIEIAKLYFELSNKSDFTGISKLLTGSTTYSSQNTGLYLGRVDIIAMQKKFHGSFAKLHWHVNSIEEVKPGVVLFDYEFEATKPDGELIMISGLEYVLVFKEKIVHIEIRNK